MVFPLSSTVTCGCDRITAKETQTISNDPCRINQPADAAIRVEQARAGARGRSGRLAVRAEPEWCEKYKCGVRLFQHALEALQQRSGRRDRRTSRAWRHRAIQHRHSMINGSGFRRELIEIYSQQHPEVAIEIVEGASTEHTSLVRKSAMIWRSRRMRAWLPIATSHRFGTRVRLLCSPTAIRFATEGDRMEGASPCAFFRGRVLRYLSDCRHTPSMQKVDVGRETVMHLVAMGRASA